MDFRTHLQADEQQILECQMQSQASYDLTQHERRSANYKPNIWKHGFLESLDSKYQGDDYKRQFEKLIEDVKNMTFVETENSIAQLELVDSITKLGLTNHFEKEIKETLDTIASVENNNPCISITDDLYTTALYFKILRQQGYKVSQDLFGGFMDEEGTLKKIHLSDVKGMLELFEASNLALEGEDILDEIKASSMVALRDSNICNLDNNLARHVVHALELSSHRRVRWFNVKGHIDAYEKENHVNTILIELAKLNFNMVQAKLQKDLREASMWDVGETEQLPECMKICFQVLYNTTCEIAHEIEEENGWNQVLPQLSKVWADFCKALLVEAEWYSRAYTPSLEEYLSIGCISSSVSLILVHTFFSTTHHQGIQEIADFLHKNEDLVYNMSLIVRLTNDLGTSAAEQERGDAPSAILCYMREVNVCEDIAEKNIKDMIESAWKKINGKCLRTPQVPSLSPFINITTNIVRVAHSLYQNNGDGFGDQEQGTRILLIQSLLVQPLLL
ncbi:(E E)-alpha-farnesene synthase isoform X2 [Prunus yedoensis var. nudiflora]|uniref:(E E)-alpha-farnesene synthase isoform X2 n=1 Tax=Prunus yedoensis var. nudiflora TaxID=2094558 RepID=A0A314XJ74_PRUYE|nr:(E E)-alpha-farnesene synthase isoform X2 [Prunus yedoensis var. nudiflora]